jgi:phenylacetyl-CoA:acceptor oxidoreductase subunit 1
MAIDLERCIGCYACVGACKDENATTKGILWSSAVQGETGTYPNTRRFYIPTLCNHCADAPCVTICPTGASYKRADGIVLVDPTKCIGCQYCVSVCPYGARHYLAQIQPYFAEGFTKWETVHYTKHTAGVVEKCTFCVQRIDAGTAKGLKPGVDRDATPACVNACLSRARIFGDLDDPKSNVSQAVMVGRAVGLRPELGTKPSVLYLGPIPATGPNLQPTLPPLEIISTPGQVASRATFMSNAAQVVTAGTSAAVKEALKPIVTVGAAIVAGAALITLARKEEGADVKRADKKTEEEKVK